MKFEILPPDPDKNLPNRTKITFFDEEIDYVARIFSEHIRRLIDIGNPSSVQDYDKRLASHTTCITKNGKRTKEAPTRDIAATYICNIFNKFIDNTEEEVDKIWENTEPAMLAGEYADLRNETAVWAEDALKEIEEFASYHQKQAQPEEIVEEDINVEALVKEIDIWRSDQASSDD